MQPVEPSSSISLEVGGGLREPVSAGVPEEEPRISPDSRQQQRQPPEADGSL